MGGSTLDRIDILDRINGISRIFCFLSSGMKLRKGDPPINKFVQETWAKNPGLCFSRLGSGISTASPHRIAAGRLVTIYFASS